MRISWNWLNRPSRGKVYKYSLGIHSHTLLYHYSNLRFSLAIDPLVKEQYIFISALFRSLYDIISGDILMWLHWWSFKKYWTHLFERLVKNLKKCTNCFSDSKKKYPWNSHQQFKLTLLLFPHLWQSFVQIYNVSNSIHEDMRVKVDQYFD